MKRLRPFLSVVLLVILVLVLVVVVVVVVVTMKTRRLFLNRDDDERLTDPETTSRVVRRGDSLASIAADAYGDPTQWRAIAEANGIENPFAVSAGATLTIPKQ